MTLRISLIPTSGLRDVSLLELGAEGLEHKNSNRVVVWAMNLDIKDKTMENLIPQLCHGALAPSVMTIPASIILCLLAPLRIFCLRNEPVKVSFDWVVYAKLVSLFDVPEYLFK